MTSQTVHVLPNAQRVCVRPTRPTDAPGIQDFVRRLSAETRRARFFAPIRELAPAELARLSSGGGLVFVAETSDGSIVALADFAAGDDAGPVLTGGQQTATVGVLHWLHSGAPSAREGAHGAAARHPPSARRRRGCARPNTRGPRKRSEEQASRLPSGPESAVVSRR